MVKAFYFNAAYQMWSEIGQIGLNYLRDSCIQHIQLNEKGKENAPCNWPHRIEIELGWCGQYT